MSKTPAKRRFATARPARSHGWSASSAHAAVGNAFGRTVRHWSLALVLLSAASWSVVATAAEDLSQYLRDGHPQEYRVQKGDTLWDISGRFLSEPWVWPELWRANPQIDNPHLIYPGDLIRLVYGPDGQPRLQLERGVVDRPGFGPQIRSTPLESAIPAIRLDAIRSFLEDHRIVTTAELEAAPSIIAGENRRLILGAGDKAYARGPGIRVGSTYGIVRRGELFVDPDTNEVLGLEADAIGLGRVVAREQDIGTVLVNTSREEVRIDDRLLATEERRLDSTFFPSSPAAKVRGRILAVKGGVTQVGQWNVVVLNRGEREGVQPGNVLAIYRQGEVVRDRNRGDVVRLPAERSGLMMVFRTFERVSYALVLQTDYVAAVLDEFRSP